jgi:hypothetical protein
MQMKRFILIPVLFFLALCSCNKITSSSSIYIEGTIVNGTTFEVLDSAIVEIYTNNKIYSATSDENGYFYLGKFAIGDYTLIISKDGYSTELMQIDVSQELILFDSKIDVVKSYIISLYELSDGVDLTLLRRVPGGVTVAAAGFPYMIATGIFEPVIEGITDESGRITTENIPSSFYLIVDHEYNGNEYVYNRRLNTSYDRYAILTPSDNQPSFLGLVSANVLDADGIPLEDFPVNSSIELRFSQAVDTVNSYVFLEEDGWAAVEVSYTWSEANTIVVLDPIAPLGGGLGYEIVIGLTSEDQTQVYYEDFMFSTTE